MRKKKERKKKREKGKKGITVEEKGKIVETGEKRRKKGEINEDIVVEKGKIWGSPREYKRMEDSEVHV